MVVPPAPLPSQSPVGLGPPRSRVLEQRDQPDDHHGLAESIPQRKEAVPATLVCSTTSRRPASTGRAATPSGGAAAQDASRTSTAAAGPAGRSTGPTSIAGSWSRRFAGCRVRHGAQVRAVDLGDADDAGAGPGCARVEFDCRGRREVFEAQWVLDCSGRAGVAARRARRPGCARSASSAAGARRRPGLCRTSRTRSSRRMRPGMGLVDSAVGKPASDRRHAGRAFTATRRTARWLTRTGMSCIAPGTSPDQRRRRHARLRLGLRRIDVFVRSLWRSTSSGGGRRRIVCRPPSSFGLSRRPSAPPGWPRSSSTAPACVTSSAGARRSITLVLGARRQRDARGESPGVCARGGKDNSRIVSGRSRAAAEVREPGGRRRRRRE